MIEKLPASMPESHELRASARRMTLAEDEPVRRLGMASALLDEGGHDMVPLAKSTLDAISNDQVVLSADHMPFVARKLIEVLANQRLFAPAHDVVASLADVNDAQAKYAVADLLKAGDTGPGGMYLNLDFSEHLADSRERDLEPPRVFFDYLGGLAAAGCNLFDEHSVQGRLFADGMGLVKRSLDSQYMDLAHYYAMSGYVDYAIAAMERILGPHPRSMALLYAAGAADKNGDHHHADVLLTEAATTALAVECPAGCSHEWCDRRIIQAAMGWQYAQRGDMTAARQLTGDFSLNLASLQASTFVALYGHAGDPSDRRSAIAGVREFYRASESVTAGSIVGIAKADLRFGKSVSLGETVPMLALELPDLYSQPTESELQLMDVEAGKETRRLLEGVGVDPVAFAQKLAAERLRIGQYALASIAKVLVAHRAPQAAWGVTRRIADPAEKVRAMEGVARIMAQP